MPQPKRAQREEPPIYEHPFPIAKLSLDDVVLTEGTEVRLVVQENGDAYSAGIAFCHDGENYVAFCDEGFDPAGLPKVSPQVVFIDEAMVWNATKIFAAQEFPRLVTAATAICVHGEVTLEPDSDTASGDDVIRLCIEAGNFIGSTTIPLAQLEIFFTP